MTRNDDGRAECLARAIEIAEEYSPKDHNHLWFLLTHNKAFPPEHPGKAWLMRVTDSRIDTLCKQALKQKED